MNKSEMTPVSQGRQVFKQILTENIIVVTWEVWVLRQGKKDNALRRVRDNLWEEIMLNKTLKGMWELARQRRYGNRGNVRLKK